MNDKELTYRINKILDADYACLDGIPTEQLTRACSILQVKQLLAECCFYQLSVGTRFVVLDNPALGTLEKIPQWEREAATCQYSKCADDDAWYNAREPERDVVVHICPDRQVRVVAT